MRREAEVRLVACRYSVRHGVLRMCGNLAQEGLRTNPPAY